METTHKYYSFTHTQNNCTKFSGEARRLFIIKSCKVISLWMILMWLGFSQGLQFIKAFSQKNPIPNELKARSPMKYLVEFWMNIAAQMQFCALSDVSHMHMMLFNKSSIFFWMNSCFHRKHQTNETIDMKNVVKETTKQIHLLQWK